MSIEYHCPEDREPPRGFSEAASAGGTIAISGQLAAPELLERNAPFAEQFVSALQRFLEVARSAGSEAGGVLMMRIYVTDVAAYRDGLREFGRDYKALLGGIYPATTLVEVSCLVDDRAQVEIEGLATTM